MTRRAQEEMQAAEDTPQVLRFMDAEEISLALKDASVLRDCPEVPISLALRKYD